MPTLNPPSRSEFGLDLLSPPDTVDDALNFLESVWRQRPDITAQDRMALETITAELISNVIQHNPGRLVRCRLSVRIEAERIHLATDDDGRDAGAVLSRPGDPDPLAESGRGISLITDLAEAVNYTRSGSSNQWRISYKVQPGAT